MSDEGQETRGPGRREAPGPEVMRDAACAPGVVVRGPRTVETRDDDAPAAHVTHRGPAKTAVCAAAPTPDCWSMCGSMREASAVSGRIATPCKRA